MTRRGRKARRLALVAVAGLAIAGAAALVLYGLGDRITYAATPTELKEAVHPAGARIRLETAMVFDVAAVEDVERMKATLSTDLIAFLRTVSLGELIGASAYNHLRDDLNERVRAASSGTVNELLIETMVLQ